MRFIDQVRVLVRAGRGGDGRVAWRREKYVPRGGPAGGDGGRGGDVVFVADPHLSTLLELKFRSRLVAEDGQPGGTRDKNGRAGKELRMKVPVGTMAFLEAVAGEQDRPPGALQKSASEGIYVEEEEASETEEGEREGAGGEEKKRELGHAHGPEAVLLGDLSRAGQTLVVARGGRGGRGNIHFRSATNRAPDFAEPGERGEAFWVRLELKLLADVGIVAFPNVGKSTLIRAISRARPKVGDYPFTTLVPQLGVVRLGPERTMVVADVPGLIPGASQGRGLGLAFLRHLERTRTLLHVIAPDPSPGREPVGDLDALERELAAYGAAFANRPRVVAFNKIDTPEAEALLPPTIAALRARSIPVFPICAHTGEGVGPLLEALWRRIQGP